MDKYVVAATHYDALVVVDVAASSEDEAIQKTRERYPEFEHWDWSAVSWQRYCQLGAPWQKVHRQWCEGRALRL